jgi:hypothetical protein
MNNWRRDLVGLVAVGGFTAVCIIVLKGGVIDASLKDVGLVLMGQLAGKFGTVVDYHYGSSAGSSAKDQAVADAARAAAGKATS